MCFNMYALEPAALDVPPPLGGAPGSVLSVDDETGSWSALLEVPPGWSAAAGNDPASTELFVLEGALTFESDRVGVGDYLSITAACAGAELRCEQGALAIALGNPLLRSFPAPYGGPRIVRSRERPWFPAEPGNHGVVCQSLRLPDIYPRDDTEPSDAFDGGPGGFVRLFKLNPGVSDPEQQVHKECWEEIITLTGDVFMVDEGLTARGSVLDHPQGFFHGPVASHSGAILFVHTDAPMGSPWPRRPYPDGVNITGHYHAEASWRADAEHTPWQRCPESKLLDSAEHEAWVREHRDHTTWTRFIE